MLILQIIFIQLLIPTSIAQDEFHRWSEDYSYDKEIIIPINTEEENAKYQPIDIRFIPEKTCWAKNDIDHSIRVCCWDGKDWYELESQIYDLDKKDDNYINACSIVFLIPKFANGKEKYFIYYDDDKKTITDYPDHVSIEDSYYSYEPFSGLFFESWYYKIIDGDSIVYGISQKGEALDSPISQQVTKFKQGTKNVMPKNGEHVTSLSFIYWWKNNGDSERISTAEKLVKKQIIVDGNLMVKCAIISESKDGLIKSTIFYKYYHCPIEDKRIYTDVKHEINKYSLPASNEIDVSFGMLVCGGIRSNVYNDLNFGEIPPYMHLFGEIGRILTFEIPNPELPNWKTIIGKKDDVDLGSHGWVCVDYGETGISQGIIFNTTSIVKSGKDEPNGIQIQLYEANQPKLLGLNGKSADIYLMRNSYDLNSGQDDILPNDYVVEFKAELYSSKNGGYIAVEKEALIFQNLSNFLPENKDDIIEEDENNVEYQIDCNVFLSPYLFIRYLGSKILLQNSYITAELHRNCTLEGYGRVNRISLNTDYRIDWNNSSLYRNVKFKVLKGGTYEIKIYLENSKFGNKKMFIGYKIININGDVKTNIFCKPEGRIHLTFIDQYDNGLDNVSLVLIKDNSVLQKSISDSNGESIIFVPCGLAENYILKAFYKGFLIESSTIQMNRLREVFQFKKIIEVELYNLSIKIKNVNGTILDSNINISVKSDEMEKPTVIYNDIISNSEYLFNKLIASKYNLNLRFNQYNITEIVYLNSSKNLDIILHNFNIIIKDKWNLSTDIPLDVLLKSNYFENNFYIKGERFKKNLYSFSNLYIGQYTLIIGYKNTFIEKQITIPYINENILIKFPIQFNITVKVFDSHGKALNDANVSIIRQEDKDILYELSKNTNSEGKIILSIPPGSYKLQIKKDNEIIANRPIDILNDEELIIVTTQESILTSLLIISAIIIFLLAIVLSTKKNNIFLFIKIIAILIAMISITIPWWTLDGQSEKNDLKISTKLYISPIKMITIAKSDNITVGELAEIDKEFISVVSMLPYLIFTGFIFIGIALILEQNKKTTFHLFFLIISLLLLLIPLFVFTITMSELSKVMVGGLIGNGIINSEIPGFINLQKIQSNWGPGFGYYLVIISAVIILSNVIMLLQKMFFKKNKINYK
jgi:hypothetical protein